MATQYNPERKEKGLSRWSSSRKRFGSSEEEETIFYSEIDENVCYKFVRKDHEIINYIGIARHNRFVWHQVNGDPKDGLEKLLKEVDLERNVKDKIKRNQDKIAEEFDEIKKEYLDALEKLMSYHKKRKVCNK